ncbi:MAG: TIGR02453 family protein [Burkholderiales bacterium RIFCSPLOWO2_02_FULL_57_36]|nr:MAG: TIGR02453 family protein [Burkholderiales bacterium RIFCSPLOWO2_02_FULL_57_36]
MHLRDLIQFLAELSENNNRAWFVMNKPRYDILRAEFLELVTGLITDIAKFDPAVADCNPKKALFRINRDMRFSHDKSPYKTTFSAAITSSGLKKPSQGGGPAYYFHIDANGTLLVAGGEYMPPSDRLRLIRQQVIADAAGFGKVLKNKKLNATFGGLNQEGKLTRPPKGFDADAPHLESIKLKNFIAWTETSLKKKIPADLEKELVAVFKDAYPLIAWLRQVKQA